MSRLPSSTEQRLATLVDRKLYQNEAYYHALVTQFRHWLVAMQMAMEDEEIPYSVVEKVLNRVVYGHPSGAEAHERMAMTKQQRDFITRGTATPDLKVKYDPSH